MTHYKLCSYEEIRRNKRGVYHVENRRIALFVIDDEVFALKDVCPHQGAPLCKGKVTGTTEHTQLYKYIYKRENEILQCPWHGWEFNIRTGKAVFDQNVSVKTYPVKIIKSDVYVDI